MSDRNTYTGGTIVKRGKWLVLVKLALPAVAWPLKTIVPLAAVIKFCGNPELFVTPKPSNSNVRRPEFEGGATVNTNESPPLSKTIPSTAVLAERKTLVVLDVANVAVSEGLFGVV
jgi:hypothetical protein